MALSGSFYSVFAGCICYQRKLEVKVHMAEAKVF